MPATTDQPNKNASTPGAAYTVLAIESDPSVVESDDEDEVEG